MTTINLNELSNNDLNDLSHKIYEDLDYRSQKNLGTPFDDETSDIYNAIDALKVLTELDFC